MYNKTIIAGHIARDIEIKYTSSGMAIASTSIVTNHIRKSQTGEKIEEAMFIEITFFNRTAEVANQYLRKGSKVLVDGRLKLDQWTAQDGSKRSRHSVIVESMKMLGSKGETESVPMGNGGYGANNQAGASTGYNNPPVQNSYNQPQNMQQQNTQPQQPTPTGQPTQTPVQQVQEQPASKIPEIDINEDEIPF